MDLIGSGLFPVEKVVTSVVDLENVMSHGFERLLDPDGGEVKVLLRVSADA